VSIAPVPHGAESPRRVLLDRAAVALSLACVLVALIPLGSLLYEVARRGLAGISWAFFSRAPAPLGDAHGGMAHALLGSLILAGLASVPAVPLGVLAGVYVAEYPNRGLARVVRFAAEVLAGVPSITVGVFVYGLVVLSTRQFSALAGAIALCVLMVPTITQTTGELLGRLPREQREAALALGVSRWRTLTRVLLRAAAPGITAGVMLALARVIGDAAPLLFTAFGNDHMPAGLDQPIASIPVQIFTYASSPDEQRRNLAWGAALVLVCLVLTLNGGARWLARRRPSS
jgi:phosphate transport system permease protein